MVSAMRKASFLSSFRRCRGVTLVELIVVLLVVSILGIALALRTTSKSNLAALNQADLLRNGLVHAQYHALSSAAPLSVVGSASGFSVCLSSVVTCNAATAVIDPATGLAFSETFTDSVTMTTTGAIGTSNGARVDFDSIGRPSTGTTLISTNPVAVYTLNGAGRSASVTLRPITGFAEVSY